MRVVVDPAAYVSESFILPDGMSIETRTGSSDIALRDGWVRDDEPYQFRLFLHRGPVAEHPVGRYRGGAEFERVDKLAATRPSESTVRAVLGGADRPSRVWGRLGPLIATLVATHRVRQPLGEFELLSPIVHNDGGVVVEGTTDRSKLIDGYALGPGIVFEDLGDGWAILRDLAIPYDVLEPVYAIVFRLPQKHFLQRLLGN